MSNCFTACRVFSVLPIVRLERYTITETGNIVKTDLGFLPLTSNGLLEILEPGCHNIPNVLGYRIHLVRAPLGFSLATAERANVRREWRDNIIFQETRTDNLGGQTLNSRPREDFMRRHNIPQYVMDAWTTDSMWEARRGADGSFSVFSMAYRNLNPEVNAFASAGQVHVMRIGLDPSVQRRGNWTP